MRNQPKEREKANPPTHVVKLRKAENGRTSFERIGVAWQGEDGSLYVKLHGTQIVSDGFSIYPMDGGAQ